jgi:ankyrin repeat protein
MNSSIDVNSVNNIGWTCLMYACSNLYFDIFDYLLILKADTNIINNDGNTVYNYANDKYLKRLYEVNDQYILK